MPVTFPAREEIEIVRFGSNFVQSQRYLRGRFRIGRYSLLFEAEVGDFFFIRPAKGFSHFKPGEKGYIFIRSRPRVWISALKAGFLGLPAFFLMFRAAPGLQLV